MQPKAQSVAGRRRGGARLTGSTRIVAATRRAGERPPLVVGALFVVCAALTAYYATRITTYQPDELVYTHTAIALGDNPGLWLGASDGGARLSQLYPLMLAPIYRLFGNVTAYHLAHGLNALAMASTVVPAYLLARGVLERRAAAYMAAAVAAIVPWLTLSGGELTEVVAYPACAWALFAMHRALMRPSWRADLWALAAILVASYARLQLGILAPVFVAAVLAHELGWALTGGAAASGRADGLREARRRLLRDHVLLAGAGGVAFVALAVLVATGELQAAFGYYGNTLGGQLIAPGMWSNAHANVTFLTWGVGVLPMLFTVGLVLENAVAPRVRRVHAFATLAVLTFLAIVLSVARINSIFLDGVVQERYVMFVVPLLFVGLLAGLVETRRPAIALVLGALVVVPLIATTDFYVTPSSFWFLVSPAMAWFFEIVGPHLGLAAGLLGRGDVSRFVLGGWAVALGCLPLAVAIHAARRRPGIVAATVTAVVLAFCVTATVHSFNRVVHGSPEYRGLGVGSVAGSDWVDRGVDPATRVALLTTQMGPLSDAREQWQGIEFWNRSVKAAYGVSRPRTSWHHDRAVEIRPGGRLVARAAPRRVVVSASGVPLGLAGRELARSPDGAFRLLDTGGAPWRADWMVEGISDDGWLPLYRSVTLTIPGSQMQCREARLVFAVPEGLSGSRTVRVRGAGLDRTVTVDPRAPRTNRVRACGTGPLRLRLTARVPAGAAAPGATIQLRSLNVEPA